VKEHPSFLTLDEVLALHADQIERYRGTLGLRDLGLLKSALATPRATFGGAFLHPSLEEMTAAYLYHLVQNHPFADGNKRVGLASAIAFMGLSDRWLEAPEDEIVELVLGVGSGRVSKAEVAVFVREHGEDFRGR
jgi:death-on-curing protein